MYSIQCADALADLQHRVGGRLAQVADRYSCMTACLDQVHILMQIAYGSTNADKIVVRLRAKLQCDALACHVPDREYARTSKMHCERCHALCRLHLHPVRLYTTKRLADGHGRGRQGLLEVCTVGHKTAVDRPPTAANVSKVPSRFRLWPRRSSACH